MGHEGEALAKPPSPGAATTKPLRKAGVLEHYFSVCSRLDLWLWVTVSAKYHNSSGAPLNRATLFAALDHVVRSHPALASRLEYPPASLNALPTWIRLPSVDLNKLVEFRDEDAAQLHTILEAMYAAPQRYADDVPPWKLIVLRDGTVVFAYEHSIGDGQSGMAFHVNLLDALRHLPQPLPEHPGLVTALPDDVALVPAMEDAMDVSPPFTYIVREIWTSVWPPARRKRATAWTGRDIPRAVVCGVSVRIMHYSPEDGKRLVALAHAHGATLTGTLHTLARVVLSRLIRARPDGRKYKTISTLVPISERRHTGASPAAFCNHVSALHEYFPLIPPKSSAAADAGSIGEEMSAEKFPWELARGLVERIKREVPRAAYATGMMKLQGGKHEKYLRGLLGKKRPAAFELSNLGPFPLSYLEKSGDGLSGVDSGGWWEIDQVLFAQADATIGSAFMLNVAGTPAGGFGMTVTFSKEAVDEVFAAEFIAGFKAGIQALLASQPT